METYNDQIPNEDNQQPEQAAPISEPVNTEPQIPGKKESPFADSPYVVMQQPDPVEPQYTIPDAPEPSPKEKKTMGKVWKRVLCAVLALALVGGSCLGTAAYIDGKWEARMRAANKQFESKLNDLQKQLEDVAAKAQNGAQTNPGSSVVPVGTGLTPGQVYAQNRQAVVLIKNKITKSYGGQVSTGTATGSGFVITPDGFVVTNHHVIEGDGKLSVQMIDGQEYEATLVGSDDANDVALLKIEAENLKAVSIGSSTDLIVGDQVVAIGNPLGNLTSTLTVGYVSAKERDVTTEGTVINMIQTDAAINSGNSGGPLFNMKGEVIGITTAKFSGTSASGASIEGIGFAIPIDDVYDMLEDLMEFGYVTGAYMGVSVSDVDSESASYYGFPVGVYVHEVTKGSCAEKAGIQAKDIITQIDGKKTGNTNELSRVLRKYEAGDTAQITVFRSGKEVQLSITFDAKPNPNEETPAVTPTLPEPSAPSQTPSQTPGSDYEDFYKYWYEFLKPFIEGGKG